MLVVESIGFSGEFDYYDFGVKNIVSFVVFLGLERVDVVGFSRIGEFFLRFIVLNRSRKLSL